MDTDMTDAAYDIDIDVGAGIEPVAQPPQQVVEVSCSEAEGIASSRMANILFTADHSCGQERHTRSLPRGCIRGSQAMARIPKLARRG